MDEMTVTTLDQLKEYGKGQIVRLPDFAEDQPFVVRLKRPAMLALAKAGKIPDNLLTTANGLFAGNKDLYQSEEALKDIFTVIDVICEACFVEPTYVQLKGAGIELTDEQLLAVFNYTQRGLKALEPFRSKPEYNQPTNNDTEVPENPV